MSFTETVLLVASTVLSLVVATWLARLPAKTGVGIAFGTLVGSLLVFVSSALVGFLAYALPMGQIDFWFANLFAG